MIPKFFKGPLFVICVISLMLIMFKAPTKCHGIEIEIDVAPNTLNLQNQGSVVTVHTEIPYGDVRYESVYLNGIEISSWKADNRGYFVAKFLMSEIKNLANEGCLKVPGENILTLAGFTTDGEKFAGIDTIKVISVGPVRKK